VYYIQEGSYCNHGQLVTVHSRPGTALLGLYGLATAPMWEIYLDLIIHPGQLSLAIPQRVGVVGKILWAPMLCGWEIKVNIWWQVKLCEAL